MNYFFILFFIGFFISIMSLLIGSTTPIYLALMQFFFPELTIGNIIGADKFSSVARGIGAISSFYKHINWSFIIKKAPIFFIFSFLGAGIISEVSNKWILFLLIIAFLLAEFSGKITNKIKISKIGIYLTESVLGFYGGLLGASIKPILLTIFRLEEPNDNKIIFLKIQIQTIMFFMVIGATISHIIHGTLILSVIIPLSLGSLSGGIIGGTLLKKTQRFSGRFQKNIMRASFIFGILISAWSLYK